MSKNLKIILIVISLIIIVGGAYSFYRLIGGKTTLPVSEIIFDQDTQEYAQNIQEINIYKNSQKIPLNSENKYYNSIISESKGILDNLNPITLKVGATPEELKAENLSIEINFDNYVINAGGHKSDGITQIIIPLSGEWSEIATTEGKFCHILVYHGIGLEGWSGPWGSSRDIRSLRNYVEASIH